MVERDAAGNPTKIDRTKGWIKPNPVEGANTDVSGNFPTFDFTVDDIKSELYTPSSTANLQDRIRDKLKDCIKKKKCSRIYIDLTGKEGDLPDLLRKSLSSAATTRPEVNTLEIYYKVGNDLFLYQS